MTDSTRIEERLRRAFDAETTGLSPAAELAGTVIARGRRTRRVRRAGAGLAVAAAVALALIVPTGILDSSDAPIDPAGPAASTRAAPSPDQLPQGAPPKVPYAENLSPVEPNVLRDGERRVSLDRGQALIPIARVDDSWLVVVTAGFEPQEVRGELALVPPDGTEPVRIAAGVESRQVSVSPDGTQAAFVRQRELIVVDLRAPGSHRAKRAFGPGDQLLGWNPDGIWTRSGSSTSVWLPGSAPRPVPGAGPLRVDRHTRRMVESAGNGCVAVSELRAGGLARLWRKCRYGGYVDPAISPDGRYVALPTGEAIPVDGGASRQLAPLDNADSAVWEDATHILVQTAIWGPSEDGSHRTVVVRCDVPEARCELAFDRTVNRPWVSRWLVLAQS